MTHKHSYRYFVCAIATYLEFDSSKRLRRPLSLDSYYSRIWIHTHTHTHIHIHTHILFTNLTSDRVETMAVSGPGNVLVCGHTDGRISLRAVWNLQQTHIVTHSSHGAIKCLWFTEGECFIFISIFLIIFVIIFLMLPSQGIYLLLCSFLHSYLKIQYFYKMTTYCIISLHKFIPCSPEWIITPVHSTY